MLLAKSNPKETLREHTDALREQLEILKEGYGEKINGLVENSEQFWRLLDIAVEFHDLGKAFTPFQNVIREKVGEPLEETEFENDIYHNYLSPAFLPYRKLGIEDNNIENILNHTIVFHHERDIVLTTDFIDKVNKVLEKDLEHKTEEIEKEFSIRYPIKKKKLHACYLQDLRERFSPEMEDYNLYVLLKGLLHKLDHSASAHECVEEDMQQSVGVYVEKFLLRQYGGLREVQQFAKRNREKNIILIASTGMGKTETALMWINEDKAFFTLPLRVSINALFDRISEREGIDYPAAGLLHSTSLDYLQEKGYEDGESIVEVSKLLSKKLTFSTIDQIFKFPFLYRGYEKEYATLAYSKVVIDEIQAYSPEIAAVLVKGLEMIHKIGGKFMVMTATMPTIYIEEMKKRGLLGEDVATATYNTQQIRHHLKVKEKSIVSDLETIIEKGRQKKVLMIVNTVKDAVTMYEQIKDQAQESVNLQLLHSMFVAEDRSKLENQIKVFADNKETTGIWITTQLVEASLDIDFDILYTQISTLDSLFQRLGRCNRKGEKRIDEPNIYIYTKEVSGIGSIYDEEIVEIGLELLKKEINKEPLLSEEKKVALVAETYSIERIAHTQFYDKFNKALNVLDNVQAGELDKNKAQQILREIDSITAIPRSLYDQIRETIVEEYIEISNRLQRAYEQQDKTAINLLKQQRRQVKREIMKKTVNIPSYKMKGKKAVGISETGIKGLENICIVECEYDIETDKIGNIVGRGVLLEHELSPFI